MKTGFSDPIARKPGKTKKSPWDFRCPPYDERTSCYTDAGSHYGIGYRNPVGHKGPSRQRAATMPFGRVNTMETSYVPPKMLDQEYIE
jgi:hypothetical protein